MADRSTQRRLSAILMADVAGYSRLMGEDEEATVRTLKEYRDVFAGHIASHRGRLVNAPGDSVLAEFPSVVDAVAGAVEIQRELAERNTALPESRRMAFRIGINLGDVISEEDAVYGDGVNIAARLEALAEPGGICIARNVYDQVQNKLDLDYEYQGEHQVKNIAQPVRVYRVLMEAGAAHVAAGIERKNHSRAWKLSAIAVVAVVVIAGAAIGAWSLLQRAGSDEQSGPPLPDKPSIAVLPFVNMSGDPEQEYFSDGITDTLITDLSKLRELFVIARNSAFTYKGRAVDVRQVGRELGVRYVLEGGVQRSGQQIRINVQLVDALTGDHLWAERYDREYEDIFDLQDEISRHIVTELDVKLVEGEQVRVWRRSTNNARAYDLFLRGLKLYLHFNRYDMDKAQEYFEDAIELDPNFTAALEKLSGVHYNKTISGWTESPAESIDLAQKLAEQAIELDDSLADGYARLGLIHLYKQNHDKALEHAEQGVAITTGREFTDGVISTIFSYTGEPQRGLELIQQVFRRHPIPPPIYFHVRGAAYLFLDQYEKAISNYETCAERLPELIWCRVNLAVAYMETGREQEAREQVKEALRINPELTTEGGQLGRIKDPVLRAHWKELLQKAGLP